MHDNEVSNELLQEFLKTLQAMSEDDVRDQVVAPYLKSIGAKFVISPSGTNERGKDLYYRLANNYGEDEIHVCQVKNKPFNAQASSNSSVQTAINQISQSLTTTIMDPDSGTHVLPRFATFVNTYELPDRGFENQQAHLEQLRQRSSFICGLKFARQVRERAPLVFSAVVVDERDIWVRVNQYSENCGSLVFGLPLLEESKIPHVNIGLLSTDTIRRLHWSGGKTLRNLKTCVLPTSELRRIQVEFRYLCGELGLTPPFISKERATSHPVGNGVAAKEVSISEIRGNEFTRALVASVSQLTPVKKLELGTGSLESLADLTELLGSEGVEHCDDVAQLIDSLTFSHETASALLEVRSSILLTGVAGAGKSSTVRKVAALAQARGIRCIYFACKKISSSSIPLRQAIKNSIADAVGQIPGGDPEEILATAQLIILDGCDEAATIDGRFSSDLHDLLNEPISIPVASQPTEVVKGLLNDYFEGAIGFRQSSTKLELRNRLTDFKLAAIAGEFETHSIDAEISQLRELSLRRPRFIITSRPNIPLSIEGNVLRLSLLPLDDIKLHEFFRSWCQAYGKSPTKLNKFLNENAYIRDVCRTPITATILVAIYVSDADLPRSRSELYQKRFDLLLEDWDHMRGVPRRNCVSKAVKMRFLAELGYVAHLEKTNPLPIMRAHNIWESRHKSFYPNVPSAEILEELAVANGVVEIHDDMVSFGHLSYVEYLAAFHIMVWQIYPRLAKNLSNPRWRNIAIFYAGLTGKIELLVESALESTGIHNKDQIMDEILREARTTSSKSWVEDILEEIEEDAETEYWERPDPPEDDEWEPESS